MNVLHLVSQYPSSAVYKELLTHLSKKNNIKQWVFYGSRKDSIKNRFSIEGDGIVFTNVITHGKLSRILYYPRIKRVANSIEKNVGIEALDLIHAHTLFGDGGTALLLKEKHNIDYVATVRSTDTNGYLKRMPHVRLITNKIIANAKRVIFVSPSAVHDLMKYLTAPTKKILKEKMVVIPNGIDDYWLKNTSGPRTIKRDDCINFLQVSEFLPRKNICVSIAIIKKLNDDGVKCHLDVVGDGVEKKKIIEYINNNHLKDYVTLIGKVNDKNKMKSLYDEHDIFIMPSEGETFGLVYAEALSQGLPIVYTIGTGFYGFYDEGYVGYGINPNNVSDAVSKIKTIITKYRSISKNCRQASLRFNWDQIADQLVTIYKNSEFND